MKKLFFAVVLLAVTAAAAKAAEANPPLLCDGPTPVAAVTGYCPPPPPICPPPPPMCPPSAPLAAPEPEICAPPPPLQDACAPAAESYRLVTKKKKTYQDEAYVVEEKRYAESTEVRSRAGQTHSPRLARVSKNCDARIRPYKPVPYVETYEAKVRTEYTEPVTKTRRVAVEYDEVTLVPERRGFGR